MGLAWIVFDVPTCLELVWFVDEVEVVDVEEGSFSSYDEKDTPSLEPTEAPTECGYCCDTNHLVTWWAIPATEGFRCKEAELDLKRLQSLATPNTRILYLFSGKARPGDAADLGRLLGVLVDCVDIERHHSHDLVDQHAWAFVEVC